MFHVIKFVNLIVIPYIWVDQKLIQDLILVQSVNMSFYIIKKMFYEMHAVRYVKFNFDNCDKSKKCIWIIKNNALQEYVSMK